MSGITIKHNMCYTPTYRSYIYAKGRCNNTKNTAYSYYGGRGIKFLFSSFEDFFKELGEKPKGLTLDRIDSNGNYEPGNVQWASRRHQVINRRKYARLKRTGKGYSWSKRLQRFDVRVCYKNVKYYLGLCKTEEEAQNLYNQKLTELKKGPNETR